MAVARGATKWFIIKVPILNSCTYGPRLLNQRAMTTIRTDCVLHTAVKSNAQVTLSRHTAVKSNAQVTLSRWFSLSKMNNAGHSKWQNIRHIKGAKDATRAKMTSRYVQEINLAIKEGNGPDPKFNNLLARVIERAEKDNVPKQTIQTAIKRMVEGKPRITHYYHLRGPGNCSLIVETYTENTTRTKNDISAAIKKLGGRLGESNNNFCFDKKGAIYLSPTDFSYEKAEELAIEAGAEEVEEFTDDNDDMLYKLVCAEDELFVVKKMLELKNVGIVRYENEYVPAVFTAISEDSQASVIKLIDKLEAMDVVVKVYDNVDVAEK